MTAPARSDDEFARRVQAFERIHAGVDSRELVANLATRAEFLDDGERRYPVSVDDGDIGGNAWVCSPRTTYGDYASEEAVRYAPSAAEPLLRAAGRGLDGWLRRAGIDRAVAINNWWLSTNLYPQWRPGSAARLLRGALQRWPDHAVWLRSLNRDQHAFNRASVGRRCEVLVERKGKLPGQWLGKSPWLQSVWFDADCAIGDLVQVELGEAGPNSLEGRVLLREPA